MIPQILKMKGLDGIAITDHNHLTNIRTDKYIAIPGIELSTSEGHLIGLGIEQPIKGNLSTEEAINSIHKQSGVAVIAHPFDIFSKNIDPILFGSKVDAVETLNASEISLFKSRGKIEKIINKYNLTRLGGSDSHIPHTIGYAYTEINTPSKNIEDLLDSIKSGNTRTFGRTISPYYRILKIKSDIFKII